MQLIDLCYFDINFFQIGEEEITLNPFQNNVKCL
jgi:hypothetical protein